MLLTANIFQPLIDVFEAVIKFFHNSLGVPWGWAIVLLTVVIRALLIPLTVKQFHSMQRLQSLQPQMKEIQNKYKEDKQRQQQELMKFYKENNVNPLGSCLPMVAQLPVFISLFYMLRKNLREDICPAIQAKFQAHYAAVHHISLHAAKGQTVACGKSSNAHFLFINDLTNSAKGGVLVALIVLYVGTQLGSTLLMSSPTMDKNQRRMMLFMPLIFVLFIIGFPAGVIVYWITTNMWTILQQYVVKRRLGPVVPVAAAAAAGTGAGATRTGPQRKPAPTGKAAAEGGGNGSGGGGLAGAIRSKLKPEEEAATVATDRPRGGTPPPPPRKKKKRSGRRR